MSNLPTACSQVSVEIMPRPPPCLRRQVYHTLGAQRLITADRSIIAITAAVAVMASGFVAQKAEEVEWLSEDADLGSGAGEKGGEERGIEGRGRLI